MSRPVSMRSRAVSQSQIEWPAPTSASAFCSASLISPCASAPPAKACCMMVKAISMTISTSPPASAGCTTEWSMRPVTASQAATTQKSRMIQVGISMIARSKPRIASHRMTPSPTAAVSPSDRRATPAATLGSTAMTPTRSAKPEQPEHRHVAVAHMPAVQMQIGVEEDEERAGEHHLGAGPPGRHVAARALEHAAPEAEIDGDVGEDGPGERRRRREHRGALDDEEHAQEEREKPGDPEHHAAIERVAVDHAFVGARPPQMDLGNGRIAELGDVGDDRAGIERDAEDVGLAARNALRRKAFARRHRADALPAEVGPDQAGADEPVMRHDEQPVDLLVGGIGEREDDPVCRSFRVLRAHLDASHDAVRVGGGGDLQLVRLVVEALNRRAEVDGIGVDRQRDRFERERRGREKCGSDDQENARKNGTSAQRATSGNNPFTML